MKAIQNSILIRYYSTRSETVQMLMLCTGFSLLLQLFRMMYTGQLLFLFLVWNLFLAWIPWFISGQLENQKTIRRWTLLFFSSIWLLFLPNAFYILTDLFHIRMSQDVPLWYDLALILSFAWNGLLLGIVSLRTMEKILEAQFKKNIGLLFIIPVMFLNGLGIYVGRYLRYNSWDVVTNPFQLTQDIIYIFMHPIRSRFDWSMIICYTLLLSVIYIAMKKMSRMWQ